MECIGARLENDVGYGAGGTAKLSFEVVRGDVYRLDGVCRRDDDLQKAGTLVVVDAFDLIQVTLSGQSIGPCLQGALSVEEL